MRLGSVLDSLALIVTLLAIGIVQVGVDDATWLIFLGLMLAVLGLIAKGSRTTSP
jgi:hypothetical protein